MNPESKKDESSNATPMPKVRKKFDAVDLLVFLMPFSQFIEVRMIGVLTGSDVFFLLTFLYLAIRMRIRLSTKYARTFIVLCLLWLSSQILTDMVRHTRFDPIARSWSSISITLVGFIALMTLLYGRPRRIVLYGWGCVLGSIVVFFVNPSIFAADEPWKFGLAFPVTLAVILVASRKECRGYLPIQLCIIIGMINVFLGARSMGGVCIAAAIYVFMSRRVHKRKSVTVHLPTRTKVAMAISLLLGAGGVAWAYQYVAGHGMLGEEAQGKFDVQSAGKYGFLLGGRTEMLGSIPAIYDSPILGHGSQAADPKYILIMQESLAVMGYDKVAAGFNQTVEQGSTAIPVHSYLFGAWVWAGLLGAVFWAWVWSLGVRTLMRVYPGQLYILPLAAFAVFQVLWDILFSPYGTYSRVSVPYFVVIFMSCLGIVVRKAVKPSAAPAISHPRIPDFAEGADDAA